MNMLKAINKAHQTTLNKLYKVDRKYNALVDAGDMLDDTVSVRKWEAQEAKQEACYETLIDLWDSLPKREQTSANKQYEAIHGYTIL